MSNHPEPGVLDVLEAHAPDPDIDEFDKWKCLCGAPLANDWSGGKYRAHLAEQIAPLIRDAEARALADAEAAIQKRRDQVPDIALPAEAAFCTALDIVHKMRRDRLSSPASVGGEGDG